MQNIRSIFLMLAGATVFVAMLLLTFSVTAAARSSISDHLFTEDFVR